MLSRHAPGRRHLSAGGLGPVCGQGRVRMACWKDSGPVSHCAQVGSGFSLDHEGWAAR